MTLEEFQKLSSAQRRAMTAKEAGPFYAQMFAQGLNDSVTEQDRQDKLEAQKQLPRAA
jgi:hypothetical protein